MLHDLENDQISLCQIYLSPDLKLVLDLGYHPLCDSLLTSDQLKEPEITYPLTAGLLSKLQLEPDRLRCGT